MSRAEEAFSLFRRGQSNCSQTILSTYSETLGLDRRLALSVAAGFGAGMGRMGEVCGAVTGAFMVIGLHSSMKEPDGRKAIELSYRYIQDFARKFKLRHQSIKCRELTGYDLSDPEQRATAREKGIFITLCPGFVKDAAELLEELLFNV